MNGGTKIEAKHNKPRMAAVRSVGFRRPHRLKKNKKKKKKKKKMMMKKKNKKNVHHLI
jgi:hypothetical protein